MSAVPPPPPQPPSAPRKASIFRRGWFRYGLVSLVSLLIGVGIGSAGPSTNTASEAPPSSPPASPAPPSVVASPTVASPTSPPTATANPDGTFTRGECDYTLGNPSFSTGTYPNAKGIASTNIKNTGNVGIVLDVKAFWNVTGSAPLRAEQKVKVAVAAARRVNLSVSIPPSKLDALQTAAFHNKWCGVNVSIVDTYGPVQ